MTTVQPGDEVVVRVLMGGEATDAEREAVRSVVDALTGSVPQRTTSRMLDEVRRLRSAG